ncbi:DUF502 domain-containing protein [Hyphomonas sp.]|uniref:DUF502 domain-containing protein n=1 Tax=Hyphomonas sp. TaxID=87 RepID=UPI00391C2B20
MTENEKPDFGLIEVKKPAKPGLLSWLRARFVAGMFLALPIVVTFMLLNWLIGEIDKRVVPLLPPALQPQTYLDYAVPGFGLIVLFIFLTMLGAVTTNFLGRYFVSLSDRIILGIPVVRSVYSAFKQITDVFQTNTAGQFDEVVMVQYPRQGTWAVGFVSGSAKGVIRAGLGENFLGVFVPTTPNPTSGFLLYVPEDQVRRLDMTIEEGVKVILSAGLVVPEVNAAAAPKPAEELPES